VTSVHVLVPQVEGTVRDLARVTGVPTTVLRDQGARLVPRSLDELLADPRLRAVLGDGFATLLEAIYTDPLGKRLRHRVAHGNLRGPEIFTRTTAEIVLYTILQLAKYKS